MAFVNRTRELATLRDWWEQPNGQAGIVWGRRRVGKTALIQEFARARRGVFHTGAGRPPAAELALLSREAAQAIDDPARDLAARPYVDWDDALEHLARVAETTDEPLLLVLDEFPELAAKSPELPGVLRAFLDRAANRHRLRVLICGSAVRSMEAAQEYRAPLYGRFDLSLLVHPFTPAESAQMLPRLDPSERAVVYGLVGGIPLYLSWWDQEASLESNLERLACRPAASLLNEAQLVLSTEAEGSGLAGQVLYAIASGKTRYAEIKNEVRAEPQRILERLIELRLVERLQPVTETERTKRRIYRLTDNLLAFYLGVLDRYRSEIGRGLGQAILPVLLADLDDHLGKPWEAAFRDHVRRLAVDGALGPGIVAVGPYWQGDGGNELDVVALAGRSRTPVLAGEAKWRRVVDGARLAATLARKAALLPGAGDGDGDDVRLAVCARDEVRDAPPGTLTITAQDIFASTA